MTARLTLLVVAPALVIAATAATQRWSRWWWSRRVVGHLMPGPARRAGRRGEVDRLLGVARRVVSRRRAALADDVAPTLDALARSVAAGSTLGAAIDGLDPAPARQPFATAVTRSLDHHRLGVPLADALAAIPLDGGLDAAAPEVRLGCVALECTARYGGATASTLDRVAAAVRERRAVVAERAVQSAQARLSALVLTVLPVGFAAWTASSDARVARFLLGTPLGAACLVAGLACNLAGWAWMRRIIEGRP